MPHPKYARDHDDENVDSLTIGERRQLHNLISDILFGLNNIDKFWMYSHAFIAVHPYNASTRSMTDRFSLTIYTDGIDDPEDKMIAKLSVEVDTEHNKLTAVTRHYESAFDDTQTVVYKALYRYASGLPNHKKTAKMTLSKLVDFCGDFVHKVLTTEPL